MCESRVRNVSGIFDCETFGIRDMGNKYHKRHLAGVTKVIMQLIMIITHHYVCQTFFIFFYFRVFIFSLHKIIP